MNEFPTLKTDRLLLRQFVNSDAVNVQRIAGTYEIARSTFVPYPYEDGIAEKWIEDQKKDFVEGRIVNFAIVLLAKNVLIGSMGLILEEPHQRAQLGYWIAVDHWNQGYCTEAARVVINYGFGRLGLHRIWAPHFKSNPASGRVLQKVGMTYEGRMRQHYFRFDNFEDSEIYGLLKEDIDSG